MKVLVTGGAGFIGSHIVDRLIARNQNVVIIDNLSTGLESNINSDAAFIKMDVRDKDLYDVFQKEKFDYIIHLAAQTSVPESIVDPYYDADVNILGTVNVLEACRRTGVKRIVFASSAAVYGNTAALPVTEQEPALPTSCYGLSKLTIEKYLALYQQLYGLQYVVLRYANVYGERQGDGGEGGVISIFTRKIAQGQPVTIFGDGGQTRDFIYVGDVAEANCCALLADQANFVANIGTQTQVSVNTMVAILKKVSGKSLQVSYTAPREGDIYHSMLSNHEAMHKLSWKPQTNLEEGLVRTYTTLVKYFV